MDEFNFSQPERRSYLIPALIATGVLALFLAFMYLRTPLRIADGAVTHSAVLPTHTVFKSGSKLVGAQDVFQDDLYIVTTLRIENHLKIPLVLNDFNGTVTSADDTVSTANAIEKNDLANVYITFPALKPLAGTPLLRESSIPAGGHAEGMVLLHLPLTEADWTTRKSASVTVDFYHQGSITIPIPR